MGEKEAYYGLADFNIKRIAYIGKNDQQVDVTNVFRSFNIYENLFSNTLTADLVFEDSYNLRGVLPLIGMNEEFVIEYTMPDDENYRSLRFVTYSMPIHQLDTSGKTQLLGVRLISPEAFKDVTTKISKSVQGSIESIIQQIFEEYLESDKELVIKSPTDGTFHQFVIPYWSPFQTINWLLRKAQAKRRGECNYVFTERLNEMGNAEFVLETIGDMVDQEIPFMDYTYHPSRIRTTPQSRRDTLFESRNIFNLNFESDGDRIDEIMSGKIGSAILTHDVITQLFEAHEYDIVDAFAKTKHLGKELLFNHDRGDELRSSESFLSYRPKHTYQYEFIKDNDSWTNNVLPRISQIKSLLTKKVLFDIPGDSRLRPGHVIHLDLPIVGNMGTESDSIDRLDSGRYLVIETKHTVTHKQFITTVKAARDSVDQRIGV